VRVAGAARRWRPRSWRPPGRSCPRSATRGWPWRASPPGQDRQAGPLPPLAQPLEPTGRHAGHRSAAPRDVHDPPPGPRPHPGRYRGRRVPSPGSLAPSGGRL